MRPEDVSTIFWAYLHLGDDEMYIMEQVALERFNKWKTLGKVYYSIDDIPYWVKDRILAHSQQSLFLRMSEIVKEINHHYGGRGSFVILDRNIYLCDKGLNKLADYFKHHEYFPDYEIDSFVDEVVSNGRVREGRTETDSDGQPGGVHGRIRGVPGVGGFGFGEGRRDGPEGSRDYRL